MKRDNQAKKIKNILGDIKKNNDEFDVLYLIDATASMSPYITAAKEESQNISKELRMEYPEKNFYYGYIFYRDPIDSKEDIHELIDLSDDVNSLPEKIGRIKATGGRDIPEDWAGAYELVNKKISWRKGTKIIIHLADAGAHGKLFTKYDKYPKEEGKLIKELEKCALKGIKIFGYIIEEDCRNSFEECSKIYRNKGGFFEISGFLNHSMNMMDANLNPIPIEINNLNIMNNIPTPKVMENINIKNNNPIPMPMEMNNMNLKNDNPISMKMEIKPKIISCPLKQVNIIKKPPLDYKNNLIMSTNDQAMINSNFLLNSIKSIKKSM